MPLPQRLLLVLSIALSGLAPARGAPPAAATNVVIVTFDGFRWQELFTGADQAYFKKDSEGRPGAAERRFWRPSIDARRAALLPFFWGTIAKDGAVFGDPSRHSLVHLTNGLWFSYPGYAEMLTGLADPRIDSNGKVPNPNVTVLEWLNGRPEFRGRVEAVGDWDVLPFILNVDRSHLPVGSLQPVLSPRTEREHAINDLAADLPTIWAGVMLDAPIMQAALEALRSRQPRVLYVMLGETDEWAHEGRYDQYLDAAFRSDRFVGRLWEALQSLPAYKDQTALVLTTDHGRGATVADWTGHGEKVPAAEATWMAVMGPGVDAGIREGVTITTSQMAATVAALIGEDFRAAFPKAAEPLPGIVRAPGMRASQSAPADADVDSRAIDRVFDAWRDSAGPGCALGISRNGLVVYEHGYGMANLETGTPIRPSSIFHVASVSKQFTAMAIMLLARDKKLSVDDDIRKYVPEIRDYGTPITIRHLLTHTSGLRDQWDLLQLARGRFEENRITEADVMDIVPRQKALNFTPGSEYVYSNTGYTLLAVIVKRVSGRSLRDFSAERIFKPLGMQSTHWHDDYTMLVPGRTSAYAPRGSGWRVSVPNYDVYGATSLFTTVGDLLKWEANFDKPIVGDRSVFGQMETPARLTSGDETGYGFGLQIGRYRGTRVLEHGGADAGYRTALSRYPERGLAIAVLCNAASANAPALLRGVADLFLGAAPQAAAPDAPPAAVKISAAALERRVGSYLQPTTLQFTELTMRDGQLIMGRSGPVLIPLAEDQFRITGQPAELVFSAGDHSGFQRRNLTEARSVPFEWRPAAVATPSALAEYAGDYYSEELDARYRLIATESELSVRIGTSDPAPARPVFRDAFDSRGNLIQFTRSGTQVTGFEITNTRVRRVGFARVPPR